MNQRYIYTIDVAHPPRHPDAVEEELLKSWLELKNHSQYRVLKIIHGYGSQGTGGSTRETVRNWAYNNKRHFEAIIYGEDFNLTSTPIHELIQECGYLDDPDLNQNNQGITIIWIQ